MDYETYTGKDPDEPLISAYEYMVIYNSLKGDLEEDIKRRKSMIKRYQEEINDLETRLTSIKNAKLRAFNKLKED